MKKRSKRIEEVTSVLSLPLVLVLVLSVLIIPFFNEDPVLKNAITGEVIEPPAFIAEEPIIEILSIIGNATDDSIWVLNSQIPDTISRINKSTNTIIENITVSSGPSAIAVDDKFVWILHSLSEIVTKIDKNTNTVITTIGVHHGVSPFNTVPTAIAVDQNSVWVAHSTGTVSRINKFTNIVIQIIAPVVSYPTGIAVDEDFVWISGALSLSTSKIHKDTGSVSGVGVSAWQGGVAVDQDSVWVTDRAASGKLIRINKSTNGVIAGIAIGSRPSDVAVDKDSVWVVNSNSGTISRINKSTNTEIATIPVGASGISVDQDYVWAGNSRINKSNLTDIKVIPGSILLGDSTGYSYDLFFAGKNLFLCGNGELGGEEECDDGNFMSGDGCSIICEAELFCGDGNLDYGEECDDGNNENGDGCDANCQIEKKNTCDVANPKEQCAYVDHTGLPPYAEAALIIEGIKNLDCGEFLIMSSGNPLEDSENLSTDMNNPGCGNNPNNLTTNDCVILEGYSPKEDKVIVAISSEWEEWKNSDYVDWIELFSNESSINMTINDWGSANIIPYGPEDSGTKKIAIILNGSEINLRVADTYDSIYDMILISAPVSCFIDLGDILFCGNGELNAGEQCDDGNNVNGDGCSATCQIEDGPFCGDGNLDDGEECDDGNVVNGDECSSTCQIEKVGGELIDYGIFNFDFNGGNGLWEAGTGIIVEKLSSTASEVVVVGFTDSFDIDGDGFLLLLDKELSFGSLSIAAIEGTGGYYDNAMSSDLIERAIVGFETIGPGDEDAFVWVSEFTEIFGGEEIENGHDIVFDSNNNVIFVGLTDSIGEGGEDFYVVKSTNDLELIWERTFGSTTDDSAWGVAVDSSDNIIITGNTYEFGNEDILVIKLNSAGNLIWEKTFGGNENDESDGVAIDSSDNIFATGFSNMAESINQDLLLLKYDSNGNLLWDVSEKIEGKYSVGVDIYLQDEIYITGSSWNPVTQDLDVLVAKYVESIGGVFCGNGIIEIGETCDDGNTNSGDGCSASCIIEVPTPSSGGGGGGGGGSSKSRTTTSCTESWTCGDWNECDGKLQTRVCTDANICNTTVFKPTNVKPCTIEEPLPAPVAKFNLRGFGIVAFSLISIAALVLLIINLIRALKITKV